MGTLLDLNKHSTHDYVDNPYWSVFQIRVKYLLHNIYVQNNLQQIKSSDDKRRKSNDEIQYEKLEDKTKKDPKEKEQSFMNTLQNKGVFIGDTDSAKVSLFVNLTMNEKLRKQNDKELD